MEEIAKNYCGRGILDGLCQGQIIVGIFLTLIYKIGQFPVVNIQGTYSPAELVNKFQLRVFIRFQKTDVKTDHLGPIFREDVHKGSDL